MPTAPAISLTEKTGHAPCRAGPVESRQSKKIEKLAGVRLIRCQDYGLIFARCKPGTRLPARPSGDTGLIWCFLAGRWAWFKAAGAREVWFQGGQRGRF